MPFDPESSTFRCDYCGAGLNPDGLGVARRVTGWTENRKNGGANAIRFQEAPTGFAHTVCLEAAKHPSAQAPQLF
jgi:hypothetical protein